MKMYLIAISAAENLYEFGPQILASGCDDYVEAESAS